MWQLCLFATDVSAYAYKHSCVDECTHCELTLTQAGLQHGCLRFNFYFDTYNMWQTVGIRKYLSNQQMRKMIPSYMPSQMLPSRCKPPAGLDGCPIVLASSMCWDLHCNWAAPSARAWGGLSNSTKPQLLSITPPCLQNQYQMGDSDTLSD